MTFTNELLGGSLAQLRERRAKLETFIREATEIDAAIREMERVCKKLGATEPKGPVASVPQPALVTARPVVKREPTEGTNADRALKILKEHPRGLNTTVIANQANISRGSVSVVLSALAEGGQIVKVGRGFWRIADAA